MKDNIYSKLSLKTANLYKKKHLSPLNISPSLLPYFFSYYLNPCIYDLVGLSIAGGQRISNTAPKEEPAADTFACMY